MSQQNARIHRRYVITIVFLMFLTGCNTSMGQAIIPSSTPLGTISAASSVTASLPPTPVPTATLTTEQEVAFALRMLQDNGGCELPCWWGIMPGEATLQTLQESFGTYDTSFRQQDGTMLYDGPYFAILNPAGQRDYYINLEFFERDNIIDAIRVSSQVNALTQPGHFAQDWRRYSIDQVLNRYGVPSQVQLQLVPPIEPGAPPAYALIIVYEDRGFWIRYQGPATYDGIHVRACPAFPEMEYIVLRLQSPTAKTPLFRPDPEGYDRPLEEATGMSLKTFHDSFTDESAQTCLEGPPTVPWISSDK